MSSHPPPPATPPLAGGPPLPRAQVRRVKRAFAAVATVLALAATGSCSVFSAEPTTVTAQFASSVGLYEGNWVAVLGVNVGKVTDIRPEGDHIVATMEIDPGTAVPADAVAALVSPSVVTDRHVELTPPYKSGPKLKTGDLIPLDHTRTPIEIDAVMAVADQLAAELAKTEGGKGLVKDSFDVMASNLKGNGAKIRDSISAMSKAIGAVTEDRDALTNLITNLDKLTAAAVKNDKTIRSFSSNLTEATELFAENSPEFGRLLTKIDKLLTQSERLLSDNRANVQKVLKRSRVTTKTLVRNERDLQESVDLLPLTFQNLYGALDPERGMSRAHANLDEAILDTQLLELLCGRTGITLPGCSSGGLAKYGPDLGVTELLLGGAK
jgi:phospholipid/cholesterol/gamma-HCH transport system substrate-binding protein